MNRARRLQIERLREDAKAGLAQPTAEELWEIVDELLPDAELADLIDRADPAFLEPWRERRASGAAFYVQGRRIKP